MMADRKPHEVSFLTGSICQFEDANKFAFVFVCKVFVELDELVSGEWKETARWIKFEEDVEESQKWSKPRVASLSFHSLLELRRSIEKGMVIVIPDATPQFVLLINVCESI